MSKINILIVEDESIIAKDIQHSLKKLGYNVVGICSSAEEAVKFCEENLPELVLMDIMLSGEGSGVDAAVQLRDKFNLPIIYLTAYADTTTVEKAKHTEPFGYIIKPFKEIDLRTTIEVALHKHRKEQEKQKELDMLYSLVENKTHNTSANDAVYIKSNSKLVRVNYGEIYFVEALKDYVIVNTASARYTIHSTMKDIERSLPSSTFIRVHRSFIVQKDKIAAIEHNNILLSDIKKEIPIGGNYKDYLLEQLNTL